MPSAMGAGGLTTLYGTANYAATASVLIATFPIDGNPVRKYTINNTDTSGSYFAHVQLSALHGAANSTANSASFVIPPGGKQEFEVGVVGNDVGTIYGWATDISNHTFGGSLVICGGASAGG